jgi:predicted nuclease with RNAse H fold
VTSYLALVITVGVDLAAEPDQTGVAVLVWTAGGARVDSLRVGVDDDGILAASRDADKVGLDCPIGWPEAFIDFVVAHRGGHVTVPDATPGKVWRHPLANRMTDDVVHDRFGLVPLSVSADRIARPAMRAAGLLASLAADDRPVDRTGSGLVVEVYPAASLKQWGLSHRGYKGRLHAPELAEMADDLLNRISWLDVGEHRALFATSDHAFDAVVAALTARAAAIGQTHEPSPAQATVARYEGWIAVPSGPLELLGRPKQR